MNSMRTLVSPLLIGVVVALWLACSPLPAVAAPLASQFFATDPTAAQIMAGATYDMNDPNWIVATNENRSIFAFKVFSGLFMLGYQTEMGYNYGLQDQQIRAIKAFQARNGLPVTSVVDGTCLALLDQQLVPRERALAATGPGFPLYGHMQQLLANDISKDTLATIYSLPMTVLPHYLLMSGYETVQCIVGQCVGTIKDVQGVDLSIYATPVDVTSDYRFVGAYFDPAVASARFPSAAVDADTVLHEYAHYLDGHLYRNINRAGQPLFGILDTTGFSDISSVMSACANGCCPRRSSDPMEWISKYGFTAGVGSCPAGSSYVEEEWAEAFSMYVAAGRDFRSAAQANATIARKYDWLKNNVFMDLEYDTDLPRGMESGCNDVHGTETALPGYAKCDDTYLWDYTLPLVAASVHTTPYLFVFPGKANVDVSTVAVSDGITVSGINWAAPVSVTGGEYSINGGAYGSAPGLVYNGDAVTVRQTSSAAYSTTTDSMVTIGGVSATFSVTTRTLTQPTISGTPATAVVTGVPYAFTPTAANAASFTISGTLPAGLTFDPATGSLSGTLSVAGSYGPLVIVAVNGDLSTALPGFTITATAPVGNFGPAGAMATGRVEHTATLLSNGKVLVTGGYDDAYVTLGTAELYDPTTDTWSPAAPLLSPRAEHSATLLPDGTVLVTGGYDDTYVTVRTAALYDPTADRWIALPSMAATRASHSAALLSNGLVLVAGGMADGTPIVGAELYDPATRNWHAAAPMAAARAYHNALLLKNGTVLVSGGYDATITVSPSAELYDPLHDTWSPAVPMQQPRVSHAATLLPDGTVLACGGYDDNYADTVTAERYDPAADHWNAASPMAAQRVYHTATLLNNGKVLVAGGQGISGILATAEVFDLAAGVWTAAGPMVIPQGEQSATLLTNGRVLLAGGSSDTAYAGAAAQIYDNGLSPDYIVAFAGGGNGSLTGVTAQRIAQGGSATTVLAVPAAGYRFVNWTGTGRFVATPANPLTVTVVTADMAVTANFQPLPDGVVVSGGAAPGVGDALAVLRQVAGLAALTPAQKAHADVAPLGPDGKPRGDGVVDLADVIVILRRAAGLLSW